MVIRAYQPFDAAPLAALFYQTVHTVNRRDYTEKQLVAWAPKDFDVRAWDRSLQVHHTLVAVEDGCAVGFGDIDSNTGYLDRLYVHRTTRAWESPPPSVIAWRPPPPVPLSPTPPSPRGLSLKKEDIRSSGLSRWNAGGFF